MNRCAGGVLLAHITDTHVACDGLPTAVLKDQSLRILEDLVDQVLDLGVDGTLFGGDNIDNRASGERDLEAFARQVRRLPRAYCIVGNHEAGVVGLGRLTKEQFVCGVAADGQMSRQLNFSVSIGNVRIVGIDTTLVGAVGGYVAPQTLRFLAQALTEAAEEHIVVVGHHLLHRPWEPHFLDSWDQDYLVANRESVLALLAAHSNVRAYLCGHHHASCIQWISANGPGRGFRHIVTASPVAYPHVARLIRFGPRGMTVEPLRPRISGLVEAGRAAVLSGRKAMRYSVLGARRGFLEYLEGAPADNEAFLPYEPAEASSESHISGRGPSRREVDRVTSSQPDGARLR